MAEEIKPWEMEREVEGQSTNASLKPWEQEKILLGITPEVERFGNESQKVRSIVQGITLNLGDDIEAGLRALLPDQNYAQAKQEINEKLESYVRDNPNESMAYEFLGGIIPSVVLAIATKGRGPALATPEQTSAVMSQFFPKLAKTIGLSAGESGIAAIGSQEGDILSRLNASVAGQAGAGGVVGGGIYTIGKGAGSLLGMGVDALRVIARRTSRDTVNREIQRIVSEAGVSPEEAVEMLMRGDIMPSNPVIAEEIRALKARSRQAGAEIYGKRELDVGGRQEEAVETITTGLGSGMERNVYAQANATQDRLRQITNKAYQQVDGLNRVADDAMRNEMINLISRYPGGGRKLNEAFRSLTGKNLFKMTDEGIEFTSTPTIGNAEYLRRVIDSESNKLIEKGGADAQIGINLSEALPALRKMIDDSAEGIADARSVASSAFQVNDAFKVGKRMMNMPNDEVENIFLETLAQGNPNALAALRLGYLAAVKAGAGGKNRKSYIESLLDEKQTKGMNFRTLFPEELLPEALEKLGVSARVAQAYTTMLGGSPTAQNIQSIMRQGASGSARVATEIMGAGRGDIMASAGLLDRVIRQFNPTITDEEAAEVTRILLSEDPAIITKAINDRTALRSVQMAISKVTNIPLQALSQNLAKTATEEISGR